MHKTTEAPGGFTVSTFACRSLYASKILLAIVGVVVIGRTIVHASSHGGTSNLSDDELAGIVGGDNPCNCIQKPGSPNCPCSPKGCDQCVICSAGAQNCLTPTPQSKCSGTEFRTCGPPSQETGQYCKVLGSQLAATIYSCECGTPAAHKVCDGNGGCTDGGFDVVYCMDCNNGTEQSTCYMDNFRCEDCQR
jgi:hypothetical protein